MTEPQIVVQVVNRRHLIVLYISMMLTIVVATLFAFYAANQAAAAQAKAQDKASRAAMQPVCEYLVATQKVYADTPPTTPAGKSQAKSVDRLIQKFGC